MWIAIAALSLCSLLAMGWFPCCCDSVPPDCSVCPDGSGPTTGYSFEISNFQSGETSPCDCGGYDATYAVPTSDGYGCASQEACFPATCCEYSPNGHEFIVINWLIVSGWELQVGIAVYRDDTECCATFPDQLAASAVYKVVKDANTECYELSADLMSYVSHFQLTGGVYDDGCDLSSLSISVTAY